MDNSKYVPYKYRGIKAHETRKEYLAFLKQNLTPSFYQMVELLVDIRDEFQEDPIVVLTKRAEQRCLLDANFNPVDWLKGEELPSFKQLENDELEKFGAPAKWKID